MPLQSLQKLFPTKFRKYIQPQICRVAKKSETFKMVVVFFQYYTVNVLKPRLSYNKMLVQFNINFEEMTNQSAEVNIVTIKLLRTRVGHPTFCNFGNLSLK